MRTTFLPFSPPLIGDDEIAEVLNTLRSAWLTTGPKVRRFEQEFAAFSGAPAGQGASVSHLLNRPATSRQVQAMPIGAAKPLTGCGCMLGPSRWTGSAIASRSWEIAAWIAGGAPNG